MTANTVMRKAFIKSLSRVQTYEVGEAGETAIELEADKLEALFQAREQQLLTGLLGEAVEVEDAYGNMVAVVPVSVIERYREGL